jgi:hypothetical protein
MYKTNKYQYIKNYKLNSLLKGGKWICPLVSVSRPALRPTQPPVIWVPGDPVPRAEKRPGRDADHSLPSSTSKISRTYNSPPLRFFMACNGTDLTLALLKEGNEDKLESVTKWIKRTNEGNKQMRVCE